VSLEDRLYPLLSLYQRMPTGVRNVAGRAFRLLPSRLRLGARYEEFRALAAASESWSEDVVQEYQLAQVQAMLRHANATCAFYRRRFAEAGFHPDDLRSLADLSRCPMVEKADVIKELPAFVSTAFPASKRLYITTGGSTGVPVGFYLQRGVTRAKEQAFLEAMWRRAGYDDQSRLAVIRGHVTTSHARGAIASFDATRDWLLLSSSHLTPDRLPEYIRALEQFRPDLLHAYPSAALQLAEYLERSGRRIGVPLQGVLCGSERLTLPQKRTLERVFECRVYRWYGHAERVVLAGEGVHSELFHFFPQYGFVEFGPPDDEGLREVIGTSFHNLVMPLIRYRTGDRVRLPEAGEAADREYAWPVAADVVGRDQEFLVSATGRRISLTAFNMHDAIFDDLYAVQFAQEEPGVAEFRYVAGPGFRSTRLPAIEAGIRRKLGDDFQITLRQVAETERTARGKHRWLVSNLPDAGRPT
jgi:phenylacetate-CoA ligase